MDIKLNQAYGQVSFLRNSPIPDLSVRENDEVQKQITDLIHIQENTCYDQVQTKPSKAIHVQENVCYGEAKTAAIYESLLY